MPYFLVSLFYLCSSAADLALRFCNHRTTSPFVFRLAASKGVSPSHTEIQFSKAPCSNKYSAACCCPPWQAHQKATVTSSGVRLGLVPHGYRPGSVVPPKWAFMSSSIPSAAACQRAKDEPRSTSRCAALHCPKATASSSGVPPAMTAPDASISAPASIRASSTSILPLLAAQWRGSQQTGQQF